MLFPADDKDTGAPGDEPDLGEPAKVDDADGKVAPASAVAEASAEPVSTSEESSSAKASSITENTGDVPMWGGTPSRNMVNGTKGLTFDFDPESGKGILWTAKLGSQTYGNPTVANGKVLVGTNNGGNYRPAHKGDRGVLVCFNESDGKFLWQLTREKLPQGRVNDWPLQGICSAPVVEGNRLWVVTNRCELMCVDLEGFYDDENDGIKDEVDKEKEDADIIWNLDMIEELGVFPHNLATSSPVIHGDYVYIVTSNGVDEAHLDIPSPRAPCFLCVNKNTGEVKWEDNTPFDEILHGQWSSPAIGIVDGKVQIYMPGGDGWLYTFNEEGKLVWKFDLNPKETKWELGGKGDRNAIIATPVFYDNSVILAVGQDPEHGNGTGHLYRIDARKEGDVSPTLGDKGGESRPNPNSAQIWHYGGVDDEKGTITGKPNRDIYRRTMSTVAVADGLVYAADLTGFLHCIDFKTGKRKWEVDTFGAIWGSPMVVDGRVLLGNEESVLNVMKAGPAKPELTEIIFKSSIYTTPTIANGVMYVSDRSTLYAIKIKDK